MAQTGDPACVLVRLFKTTSYDLLAPELQTLVDRKLEPQQPNPSLTCLTLLSTVGIHEGWNDPALSSRFRVIPLNGPKSLERLPMFQQLFRQLKFSLPPITASDQNLLVDPHEHRCSVFHVPEALDSPHVPAQEEFVRKYGIRSVLGFGAPLPDGDLFSLILFSKDYISDETAQLFKPLALCAQMALAPFAKPTATMEQTAASAHSATADLEGLLAVHEQTVNAQADRLELIVQGSQIGTWDWDIPSGRVTFNERWASMLGYHLDELEPLASLQGLLKGGVVIGLAAAGLDVRKPALLGGEAMAAALQVLALDAHAAVVALVVALGQAVGQQKDDKKEGGGVRSVILTQRRVVISHRRPCLAALVQVAPRLFERMQTGRCVETFACCVRNGDL
jgi:PAS domain-containing protein